MHSKRTARRAVPPFPQFVCSTPHPTGFFPLHPPLSCCVANDRVHEYCRRQFFFFVRYYIVVYAKASVNVSWAPLDNMQVRRAIIIKMVERNFPTIIESFNRYWVLTQGGCRFLAAHSLVPSVWMAGMGCRRKDRNWTRCRRLSWWWSKWPQRIQ